MDGVTGEWHLKELKLRYSETGGSSLGTRFYLRYLLSDWKNRNPNVKFTTTHSFYEHPELTACFVSGETASCSLRNLIPRQIEDLLNLYRNSHGPNLHLRHGGPRCWTEKRSIQGLWQPSLILALKQIRHLFKRRGPMLNLKRIFTTNQIRLAQEHYHGKGRWGEGIKGFDQNILRTSFHKPFQKEI